MAFGSFQPGRDTAPMAEINMVPLIDVMLVLLVIFIITAPLLTHAVKVDLPRASSAPNLTRPEHIVLSIQSDGTLHWNGERIARAQLRARLAAESQRAPQPEIHVRADGAARYRYIAEVMADSARAGMKRIGFLSEPDPEAAER